MTSVRAAAAASLQYSIWPALEQRQHRATWSAYKRQLQLAFMLSYQLLKQQLAVMTRMWATAAEAAACFHDQPVSYCSSSLLSWPACKPLQQPQLTVMTSLWANAASAAAACCHDQPVSYYSSSLPSWLVTFSLPSSLSFTGGPVVFCL